MVDQQGGEKPVEPMCGSEAINSYVENRSRIFHEEIAIPGTGLTLHYASNRVAGYQTVITVPASGPTVPVGLKGIVVQVQVQVAGRVLEQTLGPLPGQVAEFVWDGLDGLGREVTAPVPAHIRIGFTYAVTYSSAPADFSGWSRRREDSEWAAQAECVAQGLL